MENVLYVLLRRLRTPLIVLIVTYAISILGFVLIPGQDDQGQPWHMNFFHAFYFVSFMGSTIGFGEIPYPFTDTQRMWTIVSIYATVITWLYGIGTTLSIVQDPAFRTLLTATGFRRAVRGITEPFYLVCGYGDTGSFLVKALANAGIRSVVVDTDENRINSLELEDFGVNIPGLCADAADPEALTMAGLTSPHCAGVAALTDKDQVNLTVAIACTLLGKDLRTITRAQTQEGGENIASLGDVHVINAFETFAGRLALALHSPGMYVLYDWLTGVPHERVREPLFPPRGTWILCGYGRFGKAVYQRLTMEGVTVQVIEADPQETNPPEDTVVGTGTDANSLMKAGIKDAVGIVAGTDNDSNNLSIIITAQALNPKLFTVARQVQRTNTRLFQAAKLDLVMQRGSVIAHKVFALITTPLLSEFLAHAEKQSNEWANLLVSRISGIIEEEAPQTWTLTITPQSTPAVYARIDSGETVRLIDLTRNPRNRDQHLPCVPLLLERRNKDNLVPDTKTPIATGDRILFCGRNLAAREMQWTIGNLDVLSYVCTGEEHPSSMLGRLLQNRVEAKS
ncbi:MAG: potassium transporter TrkA [Gammaproteobacteria bacterium SG8_11]|nr:MAG: potassium transporter TrkA [Gammaproteobacteria bacterium SG8_11]